MAVWDGPWDRNKEERYMNLVVRYWESVNTCLVRMDRYVVEIADTNMARMRQFLSYTPDLFRIIWCRIVRSTPFVF